MNRLITRLILSSVALGASCVSGWTQASNVIFPTNYPYTQTNLQSMDVITSTNGKLEATVYMYSAGTNSNPIKYGLIDAYSGTGSSYVSYTGGVTNTNSGMYGMAYQWSAYGTNYRKGFPGTMLQMQNGDTLVVHQINNMGTNFDTNNPVFTTSFHFHGSHVPDLNQGDNVYILDAPGSSNDVTFPIKNYEQSVGLNWYHTHPDLYTKDQVQGGLAGFIMVGDPLDPWPQYKGRYKQVNMAFSEVNLQTNAAGKFQFFQLSTGTSYGSGYTGGWQKMINGQINPIITIAPGETQIWNWGWVGARGALMPVIADANLSNAWSNCTILARDGNSAFVQPYTGPLAALAISTNSTNSSKYDDARIQDVSNQSLLSTGGRTTWAMTAPTNPGTYYLMDAWGGEESPNNAGGAQNFYVLATIRVTNTTGSNPVAQPFFGNQQLDPLWYATPDVKRVFHLEQEGFSTVNPKYATNTDPIDNFFIDGVKFGEGVLPQMEIGTVEEWTIDNGGPLNHPFHIHQGNFIVTKVAGIDIQPWLPKFPDFVGRNYVSPQDVAFVPAFGTITLRFRVQNFPGKFVWHCHILEHEDEGMMTPLFQYASRSGIRLGFGSISPSTVVVDGTGNVTNRITPFPGYIGPIVTASGIGTDTNTNPELPIPLPTNPVTANAAYKQLVGKQTLVVGTGTKSALVKVYANGTNVPTAQFTAFSGKAGASGVSLAVGGLSPDGRSIIAVGSRASGPATVRVFDLSGNLIREFTNILPGNCPTGVNVAIGDVNGDNFDDLVVSAGAGREAIVTALQGKDIVYGKPNPTKLFTVVVGDPTSKEGTQVALGYVAPATTPSYIPNLVTTPEAGINVGKVSVWNIYNLISDAMTGMNSGSTNPAPTLVTLYTPFAKLGPVSIATSYETIPAGPMQPVIASWQTSTQAAFTGIDINNMPTTQIRPWPLK